MLPFVWEMVEKKHLLYFSRNNNECMSKTNKNGFLDCERGCRMKGQGEQKKFYGCILLLGNHLKWKWKLLSPVGLFETPCPWNSPGQNTGVGSLSLLQGIFPAQGSNPGFLHCRQILYQLSHKGSQRILEWVAYPFSSGFSQPRNWTEVSCISGGFLTKWAMRGS